MCHLYPYNNVKLLRKFFYINLDRVYMCTCWQAIWTDHPNQYRSSWHCAKFWDLLLVSATTPNLTISLGSETGMLKQLLGPKLGKVWTREPENFRTYIRFCNRWFCNFNFEVFWGKWPMNRKLSKIRSDAFQGDVDSRVVAKWWKSAIWKLPKSHLVWQTGEGWPSG